MGWAVYPCAQWHNLSRAPEQSIQAAKLCLEGVNVAKDSLYFLAPALTNNHWIMENRTHVMTIGAHWFYRWTRWWRHVGQLSGRVSLLSFCSRRRLETSKMF